MSIYIEILSIRLWKYLDENYTRKCTAFYSEVQTIFTFHVWYNQRIIILINVVKFCLSVHPPEGGVLK